MKWQPKAGTTGLTDLMHDRTYVPLFQWALTRNGFAVGYFVSREAAVAKCDERASVIPTDSWNVVNRFA